MWFAALAALTLSLPIAALASDVPAPKPNIVFILADDYGIGEVSAYGADNYKTPNIDALGKTGIRYRTAYTIPLCGPSRALMLSGRYPFRTGATNQDATGALFSESEQLIPRVLKPAGYVSSMVGKWGQLPPSGPKAFGFDDYLMFKGSGIYWNTQAKGKNYEVNGETRILHDKEYMPDVMHNHAVNFIKQNRDKPFYLYYSLSNVHNEILPTPDSAADSKNLYADNVVYMDKLVGKLMGELERLQLREKTLVVFVGDNGTAAQPAKMATIGGRRLDESKGSMQEGGGRVPLLVSWPGVTPAGKVAEELIDASDFLPTFADLAGVKLPANTVIDGRSFAPQLRGEKGIPREWIFNQLARKWYVRNARFKLNQNGELFDMADAPFSEKLIGKDNQDATAGAARTQLQLALDQLNPAGGYLDQGDGSGRHENKPLKKGKDL